MEIQTWKATLILFLGLLFAMPAAAQKGMGEPTGVARQAVKPPTETMSGTIKDIKVGPCERTTGRSLEGVHLIVQRERKDDQSSPGAGGCSRGRP